MSRYYNPTHVDRDSDTCFRKRFHDREHVSHAQLVYTSLASAGRAEETRGWNKRNKKVVKEGEKERARRDEMERERTTTITTTGIRSPPLGVAPALPRCQLSALNRHVSPPRRQRCQRRWNARAISREAAESTLPTWSISHERVRPCAPRESCTPDRNGTAPRFPFIPSASASPSPPPPTVGDA